MSAAGAKMSAAGAKMSAAVGAGLGGRGRMKREPIGGCGC
jgi:hypothetical protein